MKNQERDSLIVYLQHPQAEILVEWLSLKTKDEYPATPDGIKAAMDMSFLAGRRSLVKDIVKLIEQGQK
jgi:hypothetical protein